MNRSCDTCDYHYLELGKDGLVLADECRRYAPKPRYDPLKDELESNHSYLNHPNLCWGWPEVGDSESEWCGEWKETL